MLCGLLAPFFLINPISPKAVEALARYPGLFGWIPRYFGGAGMMAMGCIEFLAIGIIGVGLWRLKPWARLATLFLTGLAVCTCTLDFFYKALRFKMFEIYAIPVIVVMAFPFYYFSRVTIRSRFTELPRP